MMSRNTFCFSCVTFWLSLVSSFLRPQNPLEFPLRLQGTVGMGGASHVPQVPVSHPSPSHPPLPSRVGAPDSSCSPFSVTPSTRHAPWAPVSPAWLYMSAPPLLPVLTSLRMDSRPVLFCLFFFFKGRSCWC